MPSDTGKLRWVKAPLQSRSQKTLVRILDATAALLEDQNFAQISVNDIVVRAGTSVGSFYARFRSKDDVLRLLRERDMEEMMATIQDVLAEKRWAEIPLEEVLHHIVTFCVHYGFRPIGLRRAFLLRTMQDKAFRQDAIDRSLIIVPLLEQLLVIHQDAIAFSDPREAAEVLNHMTFSIINQQIILLPETPTGGQLDEARLCRQIVHACMGFLERPQSASALPQITMEK